MLVAPAATADTPIDDRVLCAYDSCSFRSHSLLDHIVEAHGSDSESYLATYPAAVTLSARALSTFRSALGKGKRQVAPAALDLTVKMMGMEAPVDAHVSADDCLPMPEFYVWPTKGKAKRALKRIVRGLLCGRHMFIWGMPGTGKDAVAHVYSALTRRPCKMVTFRPGTDLAPWFYERSIDEKGSGWEYGALWKALTEGVLGRDGKRRAPVILLSDVDRADSAQAEWFRMLVDSISGRILDPYGDMVPLFTDDWGNKPQFVSTSNTCGTGDVRGRMASSNPMDAALMDRMGRKVEAHYLHWDDESIALRSKFPIVAEKSPTLFPQLGAATLAIRSAIDNEQLYTEFTHRGLCDVLAEAEDILRFSQKVPKTLLKQSFLAWLDGMDSDMRLEAKRIVDAHLDGGALSDDGSDDD